MSHIKIQDIQGKFGLNKKINHIAGLVALDIPAMKNCESAFTVGIRVRVTFGIWIKVTSNQYSPSFSKSV